jgi:lipopolysaccharide/colanic/teichoic acid biosynthesis glycosyltransferase
MDTTTKKRVAALSAVFYYLRDEAEAKEKKPVQAMRPGFSGTWAMLGRQDIMQMRTLMQLKSFVCRKP